MDNCGGPRSAASTVRVMNRITHRDIGVDTNGCLTEMVTLDGQGIVMHYDDIPESDITTVGGIPCTTALRTVIDIAPDLDRADLERVINDCFEQQLFTLEEANERLSKPDMASRRGAKLLREVLGS